ncbi:hypothetical protein [Hymenobacter daeguensis]
MELILILFVTLFSTNSPKQVVLPNDFAIRLNNGTDALDTFYGMYSRRDVSRTHADGSDAEPADSTINFKFSASEKLIIYKELLKVNYTSFPKEIKVKCQAEMLPSSLFIMIVRANGKQKLIRYDDACISTDKRVKDFQHLIAFVYGMAKRHEEVRKLPASMSIKL